MELARHRGLKVTALASAHGEQFLCSRGADHFLPRDAALPSTAFVGIVDTAVPGQESAPKRGIRVDALDVRADGAQPAELS
ncbi:hypothetical protein HEP81_01662 [Streptomyces griseofuscus]|uniref:Uncharacterized protein n=1 Tax=Streptomyces griseofuscus TaxID=146922 RepID=A0A7H1PVB1_9ACTN|nr:hypothetical protein HEP81_01662 [Streptomyces griseofuscus]